MIARRLPLPVIVSLLGFLIAGDGPYPALPDPPRPDVEARFAQTKVPAPLGGLHRSEARSDSLLPDSVRLNAAAYRAALEAAKMDPGIIVFPDTTADAKIRVVVPPGWVDPEMIFPRWDPQGGRK